MNDLKEYIVTLKSYEDLDAFYEDMETPGGDLYIPDREVDLALRRPISRSTHYYLTKEEVELLRNDPRVLSVELNPEDLGLIIKPMWTQTSNFWDKSSANNSNYKNWGLLRCVEGVQRENWGGDSILTTKTVSGTIQVNSEGRNVDVVIVDGFVNPNHPEMSVNSDGTGGTRVTQYNWLQHAATPGTYIYRTSGFNGDDDHGMHVAGTVAGNTQGWARSANIYNINPYSTDPNSLSALLLYDYIRVWHNNKPINPATGRRNPTIVNNSWGYGYTAYINEITEVVHRGVSYTSNLTSAFLNSVGVVNNGSLTYPPARYTSLEQDQIDAINEGIIVVGAAGNDSFKIDLTTGVDYNNYFIRSGFIYYYHRGMAPTAGVGSICVGAIGNSINDSKVDFSNCGPRLDLYAPGKYIMSSLHSGGVNDSRNTSYKLGKYSGTSMASPQVAGVLACLLEIYPTFNQTDVLEYLIKNSKYSQIPDSGGSYTDLFSLQGSPNRYLFYYKERVDAGSTWPKLNYLPRPSTGRMFPRVRVRR